MKILMHRDPNAHLRPIDDEGRECLQKIGIGDIVRVDITRPRNIDHHRKFFAMLQIILHNQEHYQSIDELRASCCVAIGHAEFIQTKHGLVGIPKSISFAKMDQDEFNGFYEKAVGWVLQDVLPGLARGDLDEAVADELIRF